MISAIKTVRQNSEGNWSQGVTFEQIQPPKDPRGTDLQAEAIVSAKL